jgi:hypothetical protein
MDVGEVLKNATSNFSGLGCRSSAQPSNSGILGPNVGFDPQV